ncbi:2Fe-2S iron-sulfur cluster binding domain-containing protein [Halosimplex rubrum]|uniref:2Fe-2S iron-sulfur cluster binding domain-containing protein n=1 Tax=Halosimplex rubrum TaxID=869889 RepID=A0A7D5SPI9_9EURY|nr:ferredoxin Fer [Halosimplex rubrum]QLH76747.1 2Fe-2S iron-sulfur cluster binding domain-containing protein [Halosimplex rubrum]
MESPFDVLSVEPGADEAEIKEAYRERIKDAHPDHGGSAREFQLVKAAYEELKDGGSEAVGEDGDGGEDRSPAERAEAAASPAENGEQPRREQRCRVEYLNYEVLDDRGWDLDDPDLMETAADGGLDREDYGQFWVRPRESLLEAAERHGFAWPFACRGGACANCAIIVLEGDVRTRVDHVLPQEMLDQGFQLSCNGMPVTDELQVVYNVKSMPELEDLLLPPRPFEQAHDD